MPTRITHTIATIAATALLLTAIAATASARNLSVSEQSFRISWASIQFEAIIRIRCRLTLEGSFHSRTIPKTARLLIGAITRAIFAHPCTNGEFWADNGTETEPLGTAPNKLPWHLTYESFTGTLPAFSAANVLLSRFSFVLRATVLGLTCQGRYGNATDNFTFIGSREAGGGITSLEPRAGSNIGHLVEELGPARVCPAELTFSGASGPLRGLTNTNTITIRLI